MPTNYRYMLNETDTQLIPSLRKSKQEQGNRLI